MFGAYAKSVEGTKAKAKTTQIFNDSIVPRVLHSETGLCAPKYSAQTCSHTVHANKKRRKDHIHEIIHHKTTLAPRIIAALVSKKKNDIVIPCMHTRSHIYTIL